MVLSSHIARVRINRVSLPALLVVSSTGKMFFSCLGSRLRIWSREMGSAVPSRVSLLISILRLNLVLTYGIPPEFRDGVHLFIKPPYVIRSVPNLLGHAIECRWHSLPRIRRHRASKPQGSFKRVLPWQVTMDELICASISLTHYRYEVGMLKVPAASRGVWLLGGMFSEKTMLPFFCLQLKTARVCFFIVLFQDDSRAKVRISTEVSRRHYATQEV